MLHRTRWGTLVRAATQDRDMVARARRQPERGCSPACSRSATSLAGLGGALQVPREPATTRMDLRIIVEIFVVVVVGGMGSIAGAFVAAHPR